ncbi:MAG: hypothetical protein GWN84_20530 [Gammaproteobacteria bacterium]|nr:hypothetical protein [Gammaproteobacteria bacterium]NIR85148.1 hypothetical protein [Gammaproteobacteria bacterium]NIU06197.1 hypothetical protein [Gammaproteobacteria bacterium]NIX87470.1 hypothetical protein [Gammaproteobacteria bacterium]
MIVRELITLLGVELDDSDVKKVDTTVNRFEDRMRKVGQFIGGSIFLAGFARAAGATVKFASDARETMNLVRESFGANAADVEAWSTTVAREVGRSEFLMREMAGTLGALLNPLLEQNTEAAAEMSTQLSTLAVDLASFFNKSEQEALIALRAGLSGETEPLKRFGVILTEVGLQEQARREGLTKSVQTMGVAEKTALRFRTIMHQTAAAQGDAARTANEFANAQRAAADGLRDVATRIGERLLPLATRFALWVRDTARDLVELAQKTHVFEAALLVLGGAIAALAILMVAPFLPFLVTAAKAVAVVAALTLAVDDLITFFRGGKSVIGEFIDTLFGIGAAQELIDNLNAGWQQMAELFETLISLSSELQAKLGIGPNTPRTTRRGIGAPLVEGSPTFEEFERDQRTRVDLGGRPRAVMRGTGSRAVVARRGSTGARQRLERAQELEAKRTRGEQLTRRERRELRRITDDFRGPLVDTLANRRRREGEERQRAFAEGNARRRQALAETFGFARAPAPPPRGSAQVNARVESPNIVIHEASNPAEVERAVHRGLNRALEDAGAALAEGAD